MKIIVGLGNPGKNYENTRHNAGFLVLDKLASSERINPGTEEAIFNLDKRLKSRIFFTLYRGEKVILVKPDTFMNASGLAVKNVMSYYKASPTDLIVICDDIDLPLGEARLRLQGGSAGQKGLQNIIDELGSSQFMRVRIGIKNIPENQENEEKIPKIDTADYVLQRFSAEELIKLEKIIGESIELILASIDSGDSTQAASVKI